MTIARITIFSLFLWLLGVRFALCQNAASDSSQAGEQNEFYYEIARTRLVRWLKEHKTEISREELNQVVQLIRDANDFAGKGDYETALLLLDTALGITKSIDEKGREEAKEDGKNRNINESKLTNDQATWNWQPQIITGLDFWRQEFELGFSGTDSTLLESTGNPFMGVRLRGTSDGTKLGKVTSYAVAKVSRDYYSGELQFRNVKGSIRNSHWIFENRLEGTYYKTSVGLQYWGNKSSFQGGVKVAKNFILLAGDDFQLRQYKQDSDLYPNYLQNQVYGGFQYVSGLSTRLSGAYAFSGRSHQNFKQNDFNEHRIEASVYQVTAINSSIFIENIWRQRNYLHGDSDSTYQNSYQEEYLRADLRFGLTHQLSFDLESDFTLRQHKFQSVLTPDYVHLQANPRFLFRIWKDWQVGLGYLYILRVYRKDIIQTTPVVSVTASEKYLGYEDYFSHGLSLSLELFRMGAFILSLTNQFELRTYPNSPTQNVSGFGLYTNRKINSLLLFLSWQVFPQLELGILANMDDDRSRENNHSDSRNTMFSLDLGYSF